MNRRAIGVLLFLGAGAVATGPASARDATAPTTRDRTPPVITYALSPVPNAAGWNNGNVALTWSVTDPESSVRTSGCGSVTVSSDTGASGKSYTCSATSSGGTSSLTATVKRDATPPSVTVAVPAASASYAAGQVVNASFACADTTSGLVSCVGSVANGAAIDTSTVGPKTFLVTALDKAGNERQFPVSYTVVDKTAPAITAVLNPAAPDGNNGWYRSSVTVNWTVTEPESGPTLSTTGCSQTTIAADTPAAGTTLTCSATSAGGGSSKSVTLKRDATAPTVTVTRPADGASYALNQAVSASYTCADAPAGIATCTGSVSNGVNIDTGSTGTKSFTVNAVDQAGNTTTRTVSYSVAGTTSSPGTGGTRLFAWNDLGMHCMDTDYSIFTLLPPFNSLTAQLMVNGKLVNDDATSQKYTLEYTAMTDLAGSTNSSHLTNGGQNKTNFWEHFTAMFGAAAPPAGIGLFKFPTPTINAKAMEWNGTTVATADDAGHFGFKWFEAYGIPVTPIDDTGKFNAFPMVRVTAKDNATGKVIATTSSVLPVSTEMNCQICHMSNTGTDGAKPTGGWFANTTGTNFSDEQMWRLNALRKHDEKFSGNATFVAMMAKHFSPWTKLETAATNGKPIFCDGCHNSNALAYWGFKGDPAVSQITTAMHKAHSTAKLPGATLTLDDDKTREACYSCHPGKNTQCLRGAMGNPTDALTKQHTMECQSCHGSMKVVGTAKMGDLVSGKITNLRDRRPWFDMPTCQTCHQNGQRYTTALTVDATTNTFAYRASTDTRFATNANTPNLLPGLSMYRFSVGHGNLQCAACHNSTHAEFTSKTVPNSANDDARAIEAQGYVAAIRECTACHASVPLTGTGGPHGMHTIGPDWVDKHHDLLPNGTAPCTACHGSDYRGSPLAQVKATRTYKKKDTTATKTYNPGDVVSCYDCHNGPKP